MSPATQSYKPVRFSGFSCFFLFLLSSVLVFVLWFVDSVLLFFFLLSAVVGVCVVVFVCVRGTQIWVDNLKGMIDFHLFLVIAYWFGLNKFV